MVGEKRLEKNRASMNGEDKTLTNESQLGKLQEKPLLGKHLLYIFFHGLKESLLCYNIILKLKHICTDSD